MFNENVAFGILKLIYTFSETGYDWKKSFFVNYMF